MYALNDVFLYFVFQSIPVESKITNRIHSLSVIIASKNEAQNLKTNLISILNQIHSGFEVIVVDDQSTDNTFEIIRDLQELYQNLNYISVDKTQKSSKKHALELGIDYAKNEYLVFTDADCKPISNEWLSELQKYFFSENCIVLGYSPYKIEKGNLNKLIRFETYQTALNYFSLAKIGQAYMGVGRNLAYTKTIFYKLEGFISHKDMLSGDDDLFINKASGRYAIKSCIAPKTFVESQPKQSWKTWINQKRRHITTAPHYKPKHQLWLGSQFVVKYLFWFLVIPSGFLFLFFDRFYLLISIFSVLIIKLLISKPVFKNLYVKDLWLQSFNLEFQLICLQLYIFSLNLVSSKKDW